MKTRQTRFTKDSISHTTTVAMFSLLVWLGLTLLPVREAAGQGTVIFANRIPGGPGIGITLHIWGPDPVGGLSLIGRGSSDNPSGTTPFEASGMALIGADGSGGHYGYATTFAQLIGAVGAGQPLSALWPVGQTTTFQSGAGLGAVVPIIDRLFGIPKDAPAATFAIVAWDNTTGLYSTWTQASVAWMRSQIRAGMSAPFTVTAIGGDINPPPYLNNNQGGANGMTSFNLYGDCLDPIAVTLPASAVTADSATLNATVYPGMSSGTAWLEWGTTASYGNRAATVDLGCFCPNPPPLGPPVPFSAQLTGLTFNTTYHFRAGASGHGGQFYGDDQSFTTLISNSILTLAATAVDITSATLNGTANPNGWPTSAWFQWGTTTSYGNLTSSINLGSGTNALPFSAQLAGLTPSTTYHFRAAATNSTGVLYGSDQCFENASAPVVPPLVIMTGKPYWGARSSTIIYDGTGVGGSQGSFILLRSMDATAPLSTWTRVATNDSAPGSFLISPVGTGGPRYYRVKCE